MTKTLRCVHRHTITEHPACFVKGLLKGMSDLTLEETYKEESEKITDIEIPWYKKNGLKICYLDIESDGLKANFSTMLSWCIKEKGGEVFHDVITKEELFNGTLERRILQSLIDKLCDYDIVCTYYGTGFDIKYIRTKALKYNIGFPAYKKIYHFDIYYRVKALLCLSSNSLEMATNYFGITGKTKLNPNVWAKAKYGDPESLAEVLDHNKEDVKILEQLHDKIESFSMWTRKSI